MLFVLAGGSAQAEQYLSRDICRIEFESLKKHERHVARVLTSDEKLNILKKVSGATKKPCLTDKINSWDRYTANQKSSARQPPYLDKCTGLPKHYYADAAGKTIYKLSQHQMERIETKMFDDEAVERCLSPLIN